jgi:hypothetical protein
MTFGDYARARQIQHQQLRLRQPEQVLDQDPVFVWTLLEHRLRHVVVDPFLDHCVQRQSFAIHNTLVYYTPNTRI